MTEKQEKVIAALLTNPTRIEAARAAGISDKTLRRYLADGEFQREYRKALAEVVDEAAAQARQSLAPALRCLRGIVSDEQENSGTRIQASRALLDYGTHLIKIMPTLEADEREREERERFNVW